MESGQEEWQKGWKDGQRLREMEKLKGLAGLRLSWSAGGCVPKAPSELVGVAPSRCYSSSETRLWHDSREEAGCWGYKELEDQMGKVWSIPRAEHWSECPGRLRVPVTECGGSSPHSSGVGICGLFQTIMW